MSHTAALMGMNLGEARRREARAEERGKRFEVDPEARARRVAILEARDAIHEQQQAEAKAEQEASPTALQAILNRGSIDELAEVSRSIGRMDPRKLEELVNETFRAKSRSQAYQPDVPVPAPVASAADVAEIALGAGGSAKASSTHRKG